MKIYKSQLNFDFLFSHFTFLLLARKISFQFKIVITRKDKETKQKMSHQHDAVAAIKEEHEEEEKAVIELDHKPEHDNESKETTTSLCEEAEPEAREQWSQKFDFLMSIIGFSVDLAGIWRL